MARNIIAPLKDKYFRQIPVWSIVVPLYAWVMFAWHGTADSSIFFVLQTAGLLGSVMATDRFFLRCNVLTNADIL